MISEAQSRCYELLKEIFPYQIIKQNYYVKYKNQKLYIDFYLPRLNLAIEVDGEQHTKYVAHFHYDLGDFFSQKRRDRLKTEWAQENSIVLLRIMTGKLEKMKVEEFKEWLINGLGRDGSDY